LAVEGRVPITTVHRLAAFVRLGRYVFLGGGIVFYWLGAAIAHYLGIPINWTVYVWGQAIVTATQLMVHYANDYFDLTADLANSTPTRWSGGSRVLPAGELPPKVALVAALCLGAFAMIASGLLAVVLRPGPAALTLLLLGIVLSWFYSAPPVRLLSRGMGELSAALVVAVLTPLVAFTLQAGRLEPLPFLAMLPLFCLQVNMLIGVAMPDLEGDAAAGKRTLVVRVGRRQAAGYYALLVVLAYLSLPLLVRAGLPLLVAAALAPGLPVGLWISWRMWQCATISLPCPNWSTLELLTIALLVGSAILEGAAFLALSI
jgi:1,4-dihydroxy-2-naphthoate octaprenyltransferase